MLLRFLPTLFIAWLFPALVASAQTALIVQPTNVSLQGHYARAQLLVTEAHSVEQIASSSQDLTGVAQFTSSAPEIVAILEGGMIQAVADGQAEITVTVSGQTTTVPVAVAGVTGTPNIRFNEEVGPILSKAGCNMGACHASQYGKGGFKLSVFGFEPDQDRNYIFRDQQQRRVNFLEPEKSLFLQKPTMEVPHGGSRRLHAGSTDYNMLVEWIRSGAPGPKADALTVTKVTVTPARRLAKLNDRQQLRVEATYSDGSVRDVTCWAKFDSMDEAVLSVNHAGVVTAISEGQAPVMARFEGQAEICTFVIPLKSDFQLTDWQNQNFVDELASKKFVELGIQPSGLCDDATFLRRAYLDATGTAPTIEATKAFLASTDPNKRTLLVDSLLGMTGNPEIDVHNDAYAAYWTLKWSDLLKNTSRKVGEQGMWSLHNWMKESFRTNQTFDKFVRELVTAKGSTFSNGPANYYRANGDLYDLTESTAQLFLGVRLQCAKCHHHPFEKYSQGDYYAFAAFFSRVGNKGSSEFGLFGGESVIVVRSSGGVNHPKTGKVMEPTPLEGTPSDHPLDRRIPLADWLTSKENDFFAKSIVNRYVSYLLGRGLVEPVDDMRATNPPTNVELMDALAQDFVDSGFNIKHLMRTIMTSRLYQLDSQPTADNQADSKFYSHFLVKRLSAEPLLDAIDAACGTQTKFKSLPLGTKAIELPDAEYPDYFLTTFAKPKRASVCECERVADESLAQALHTLNGDTLAGKIADANARIAKAVADTMRTPDDIITEVYLATLCRNPSAEEQATCQRLLSESPSPKEFYEDLLWALMNSKHFLFVH
ncbi:MAG: DUF1553 domain-containing protein [Planctomycetaceae bacterium]